MESARSVTPSTGPRGAGRRVEALPFEIDARPGWTERMRDRDALLLPRLAFAATPVADVDEAVTPLAAFSRAGNFLGACALSLPAGFREAGLPVAVQLMASPFDEATLIRIGIACQGASDWHRRHPDLVAWGLT